MNEACSWCQWLHMVQKYHQQARWMPATSILACLACLDFTSRDALRGPHLHCIQIGFLRAFITHARTHPHSSLAHTLQTHSARRAHSSVGFDLRSLRCYFKLAKMQPAPWVVCPYFSWHLQSGTSVTDGSSLAELQVAWQESWNHHVSSAARYRQRSARASGDAHAYRPGCV